MSYRGGIKNTLVYLLCCNLSFSWVFPPLSGNFPVGPSDILFLHNTQNPYTIVAGGCHIASSGILRVSVIVVFPDQRFSRMVSEVMFLIILSRLPYLAHSSPC